MSEAKKMKLVELHLGPIRTNCYLMIQTEKKEALIIDPGDGAATVAAKSVSLAQNCFPPPIQSEQKGRGK